MEPPSVQPPVVGTPADAPVDSVINAFPNPRYISHMPPIFVEQWRREQELAEQKRTIDAHRIASAKQAKHSVAVYAWLEDGAPPLVHEFQSGFTWPFFTLTPEILAVVELDGGGGNARSRLQLYRPSLGVWAGVSEGYTLELCEGDRVFLRGSDVVETADFDKHLRLGSKSDIPHLRHNLPRERREVRNKMKGQHSNPTVEEVSSDDSAPEKGRRRLSPPPMFVTQHRRHRSMSATPQQNSPPRKRSRATAPAQEVIEITSDEGSDVESPLTTSRTIKAEEQSSDEADAVKRWPADYSVEDVADFFADVRKHPKDKLETVFSRHFPLATYRSSTYYDNLKRWKAVKQSVRDQSLGHQWSYFLKLSRNTK